MTTMRRRCPYAPIVTPKPKPGPTFLVTSIDFRDNSVTAILSGPYEADWPHRLIGEMVRITPV